MRTKGKWKVRKRGTTYQIYTSTNYEVAKGIYRRDNAYLISEAPELLALLKRALVYLPDLNILRAEIKQAIAKAKGGS